MDSKMARAMVDQCRRESARSHFSQKHISSLTVKQECYFKHRSHIEETRGCEDMSMTKPITTKRT